MVYLFCPNWFESFNPSNQRNRLMGKASCGKQRVDVHPTVAIEAGEKLCRLALHWDLRNAALISIRFRHDGTRIAIPESDSRAGVLRGDRRKPPTSALQVLKSFQFKVPAVGVPDQYVVDGILGGKYLSLHDTTSREVVSLPNESFHSSCSWCAHHSRRRRP
jgi:hypothetical protein